MPSAEQIRALLDEQQAQREAEEKPKSKDMVIITVSGPGGETEKFIIRNATEAEYYGVIDALYEFKHVLEKERRE